MSTAAAEPSDAELLLRVRGGEPEAFADLYQRHRGMALQVAARNSRNWADAEDVTAEAFAQIYRAIVNGAGPTDSFVAYLLTAVRNAAARTTARADTVLPTERTEDLQLEAAPGG